MDRIREILAEHEEKYINHPPGPGSNMLLLMLCEDTIAAIKIAADLT